MKEIRRSIKKRGINTSDKTIIRIIRLGLGNYYECREIWIRYSEITSRSEERVKEELEEWIEREGVINIIIYNIGEIISTRGIRTTESEVTRIWNLGYTTQEILTKGFMQKFQEIKDELEPIIERELDE